MFRKSCLFVVLATLVAVNGHLVDAQRPAAPPAADRRRPRIHLPGLVFRNIGPATMGGRIDDLAVLESNPAVFYVGTATGGLWKTVNNGTTWEVLFDDQRRHGFDRRHRHQPG